VILLVILYCIYGIGQNDLTVWHMLCRVKSVEPLLKTCDQRKEVEDRVTKSSRFILTQVIGYTKDTRQYR
jgi:hypothetical protein